MLKRVRWVDNLKAFLILAVVLGHIATPLTPAIFAWHVPAFFFVSGFFIRKENSLQTFIKDVKKFAAAYVVFGFLGLVVEIAKRRFLPGYPFLYSDFSIKDELAGLFFWMNYQKIHTYAFILWFLPALTWSKAIVRLIKNRVTSPLIRLTILLIIFLLLANRRFILPFALDQAVLGAVWVYLGSIYYQYEQSFNLKINIAVALSSFMVATLLPLPLLNLSSNIFSNPLYNLFYSLAIISGLLVVVKSILPTSGYVTRLWGQNTLLIMIVHPYTNNAAGLLAAKYFDHVWIITFIISITLLTLILIGVDYAKRVRHARSAHCLQPA